MKKYLDTNELAPLFFLHYFKYTRYAIKKVKSEEDKASIHAHRELMRLFGRLHKTQVRVGAETLINALSINITDSNNLFTNKVSSIMKECIAFIDDNLLFEEKKHRLLERYA